MNSFLRSHALAIFVLLWLAAWQIFSLFELPINQVLASPAAIARAFADDFAALAEAAAQTLAVAFSGLAIAAALGILLALWLHQSPLAARVLLPIFIAYQNIPSIAIAPIFVLIFGFSSLPKLALVALSAFYPIMLSLLQSLKTAEPKMLLLLRSLGASRAQIIRCYLLPRSLAALFSGLIIAASYAFASTAAAEVISGFEGLGVLMLQAKKLYAYALMYAAILLLALLSAGSVFALKKLEKFLFGRKNV